MPRQLSDLPIDLLLYDTIKRGGGLLSNANKNIAPTWKRSTRSVGGFWMGTCEYEGPDYEKLELFQEGLMRQVVESLGSLITWRGFIAEMELTIHGVPYTRRWDGIANRVKAIYSRIGDNQFTNGSAESGAWAAYGTPTTLAQSSTWVSDGTYSCHIVGDSVDDGALIQTGITVVANKAYDCRVSVNLVSGTWKLEIYRMDTGVALGSTSENTVGDHVMSCSISDSSTYAGTIGVRLYLTTTSGEIYADAAVFQTAPERAETEWQADTYSQAEYGVMEDVLLLAGTSDADANDLVLTQKRKAAWPRAQPPEELGVMDDAEEEMKLSLVVYGDVFTTRNEYSTRTGTAGRSTHVTNLVGDCEFVSAGVIESNTRDFQIDTQAPIRIWEILQDITLAGDAAGNRWICGVFGDRKFDYRVADTVLSYRYRNGRLLNIAGGEMEPWFALPGLAYIDDLPLGPPDLTGDEADDPHVKWIEEIEFSVVDWLAGTEGSGLKFRREADR